MGGLTTLPMEELTAYYFGCTLAHMDAWWDNVAGLFIGRQHSALELREDCTWAA
jgi:hypothetical protein